MWDVAMVGLGIVMFVACLGYITVCERLKDGQDPAPVPGPVDEVSR